MTQWKLAALLAAVLFCAAADAPTQTMPASSDPDAGRIEKAPALPTSRPAPAPGTISFRVKTEESISRVWAIARSKSWE